MRHHTFHIALAATIFGAVIWISASMREQYQITVDAPLTIEGIPEGSAVRTPLPSTLQLKLRSDGWRLAALILRPKMRLALPLNMLPTGKRVLLLTEAADRFSLPAGIQLMDITPDTLLIELDRLSRKRVPIAVDCSFEYGDGYGQAGTISVTPESVTVTGAESVLRTISSWRTERYAVENLRTPLDADVPLDRSTPYLIDITPRSAHIHVSVEPFERRFLMVLPWKPVLCHPTVR
jgi:hypothetical protein